MKSRSIQTSLFAAVVLSMAGLATAQMPSMPQIPGAVQPQQQAAAQPVQVEKKANVKRVGVVLPKAQLGQGTLQDVGEPIRQAIASYLAGPSIEVVAISARLPIQAVAEAKEKQCDFVLFTSVAQKKGGGGGGFGSFMKMAAPMANMIPGMAAMGGGMGGQMAGMVVQTAVSVASQAAAEASVPDMAAVSGNTIKAKDEITIDYQVLNPADNTKVAGTVLKGKAKQDGEDLISPIIEQIATIILQAAMGTK